MPARKTSSKKVAAPAAGNASDTAAAVPSVADHFKAEKKPRGTKAIKSKAKNPMSEEAKKKRFLNMFNGMTEEEVCARGLPDYLQEGLDVVFIGINPSLAAAYSGKYYDGPGNHFWQALHLSGFVPTPMGPQDDHKLLEHKIGFTNVVARTTRGIADLAKSEIREGAEILREKLAKYRPKIAVFNGKSIYEVYSGQKKFMFGRQPEKMEGTDTWVWVMPSSSARCAQLPRAIDKVPFFEALRKFLDFLNGLTDEPHEEEIVFANVVLKNYPRKNAIKVEPEEPKEEEEQC